MRNAMNEVVRNAYVEDCMTGDLTHWNLQILEAAGHAYRFTLPSTRFRRGNGAWAGVPTDPAGNRITRGRVRPRGDRRRGCRAPTIARSSRALMQRVTEPGKRRSDRAAG